MMLPITGTETAIIGAANEPRFCLPKAARSNHRNAVLAKNNNSGAAEAGIFRANDRICGMTSTIPNKSTLAGKRGNIYTGIPEKLPEEQFETLLQSRGAHIERIISKGHTTPPGIWTNGSFYCKDGRYYCLKTAPVQ